MDIKFFSSPLRLLSILKTMVLPLEHSEFVNDAILELLRDNCVEELTTLTEIINALTVSAQSSGKKNWYWIWHINHHVFKQKFKCEGLHTIRDIFSQDYFVFSFDLKSGYHHADIFLDHFWHFRDILALIALDTFNLLCCHSVFPARLSFFMKLLKPLEHFGGCKEFLWWFRRWFLSQDCGI